MYRHFHRHMAILVATMIANNCGNHGAFWTSARAYKNPGMDQFDGGIGRQPDVLPGLAQGLQVRGGRTIDRMKTFL